MTQLINESIGDDPVAIVPGSDLIGVIHLNENRLVS
jgi:hypothetical protein